MTVCVRADHKVYSIADTALVPLAHPSQQKLSVRPGNRLALCFQALLFQFILHRQHAND